MFTRLVFENVRCFIIYALSTVRENLHALALRVTLWSGRFSMYRSLEYIIITLHTIVLTS